MAYCTNYTTKRGNTEINTFRINCFSGIYGNVKDYHFITVHVLKDYKNVHDYYNNPAAHADGYNSMHFTESEIVSFSEILQNMGFIVELDINNSIEIQSTTSNVQPCYSFKIDCQANSELSILFLLNVIRFLYENEHYKKIQKVLEWKDETEVGYYATFCIAAFLKQDYGNNNHDFKPDYKNLLVLKDDAEFIQLPCQIHNCRASLPKTNGVLTSEEMEDLRKTIQTESFKTILKKYTKLCEKYS